jgi:haloalkane dehalogenase
MADWKSEYPFTPRSLSIAGQKYAYVDEGQGDAPLVAVHGNPTWSFYWRKLVLAFRDHQRVLAVDHVGCGNSSKPQEYPYCLATHRNNLVTLLDQLDLQNVTLVVHDWGGAIGLAAAVERPERIGRLVVTNTGAFPPPYIPLRIAACRWPVVGTLAVRGLNAFARAAITMATARYRRLPENAASGLLAPYDSWDHRIAIDRFVRDIPMKKSHPTYAVLAKLERDLEIFRKIPVLLVWGMRDWCFRPECLHRFQAIWPQAKTIELPDVGHYVMEDAPEETVSAIRTFIASDGTAHSDVHSQGTHPS